MLNNALRVQRLQHISTVTAQAGSAAVRFRSTFSGGDDDATIVREGALDGSKAKGKLTLGSFETGLEQPTGTHDTHEPSPSTSIQHTRNIHISPQTTDDAPPPLQPPRLSTFKPIGLRYKSRKNSEQIVLMKVRVAPASQYPLTLDDLASGPVSMASHTRNTQVRSSPSPSHHEKVGRSALAGKDTRLNGPSLKPESPPSVSIASQARTLVAGRPAKVETYTPVEQPSQKATDGLYSISTPTGTNARLEKTYTSVSPAKFNTIPSPSPLHSEGLRRSRGPELPITNFTCPPSANCGGDEVQSMHTCNDHIFTAGVMDLQDAASFGSNPNSDFDRATRRSDRKASIPSVVNSRGPPQILTPDIPSSLRVLPEDYLENPGSLVVQDLREEPSNEAQPSRGPDFVSNDLAPSPPRRLRIHSKTRSPGVFSSAVFRVNPKKRGDGLTSIVLGGSQTPNAAPMSPEIAVEVGAELSHPHAASCSPPQISLTNSLTKVESTFLEASPDPPSEMLGGDNSISGAYQMEVPISNSVSNIPSTYFSSTSEESSLSVTEVTYPFASATFSSDYLGAPVPGKLGRTTVSSAEPQLLTRSVTSDSNTPSSMTMPRSKVVRQVADRSSLSEKTKASRLIARPHGNQVTEASSSSSSSKDDIRPPSIPSITSKRYPPPTAEDYARRVKSWSVASRHSQQSGIPTSLVIPKDRTGFIRNLRQILNHKSATSVTQLVSYHKAYPDYHSTQSYHLVIRTCLQHSAFGTASRLLTDMRTWGVPQDMESLRLYTRWMVECGHWQQAWKHVQELIDEDPDLPYQDVLLEFLIQPKPERFRRVIWNRESRDYILTINRRDRSGTSKDAQRWIVSPEIQEEILRMLAPGQVYASTGSKATKVAIRCLLRLQRQDEAIQLTRSHVESLPNPVSASEQRQCIDIINVHIGLSKRGNQSHVKSVKLVKELLSLNSSLCPEPRTLYLLMGRIKDTMRISIHHAMQMRDDFVAKYGLKVEDHAVRRRLSAIAVKDKRLDIARRVLKEESRSRQSSTGERVNGLSGHIMIDPAGGATRTLGAPRVVPSVHEENRKWRWFLRQYRNKGRRRKRL